MEWRKITKENIETIKHIHNKLNQPIVIARKNFSSPLRYKAPSDWDASLEYMAEQGKYYYLILPILP